MFLWQGLIGTVRHFSFSYICSLEQRLLCYCPSFLDIHNGMTTDALNITDPVPKKYILYLIETKYINKNYLFLSEGDL